MSRKKYSVRIKELTNEEDNRVKYVKEIAIIFGITLAGELFNFLLPLPVPAGVYGLFLLLGGLMSGIIKLKDVAVTGEFLLDVMPLLFIPAGVGLLKNVEEIRALFVPLIATIVVSTFFVMIVTGKTAQYMIRKRKGGEDA